jgi:hypothetical protein
MRTTYLLGRNSNKNKTVSGFLKEGGDGSPPGVRPSEWAVIMPRD